METKRKALGKGLEQLFNNEPMDFNTMKEEIINTTKETDIVSIPINEIRSNPYQPRKYFDQNTLEELASSIKEHGILEPVIVKKSIKGYELVAGERRTKAATIAGLNVVPAIVKDFSDEQMMDIALLENIQRDDLTPVEIAKAFKSYLDKTGITQEDLAKKFSKSRSYITNLLGLLSLSKNILRYINEGKISQSHARVLSKLEDETLIENLANKIIAENISVRELEQLVVNTQKKKPILRIDTKTTKQTMLENVLRDLIGTKVTISKNKISIPYDSEPDLMRILEILKIELEGE
ncbi:MAG: ParB/RepB/Spo0J family partition protein [Bacilli bacterium]|nr:ParB/RepB/Spo0J family partition protein [Bacilli bacterium]MDD4406519.1 ParB/RepB/Spo0J family partition protein [Bacilli bacterium]